MCNVCRWSVCDAHDELFRTRRSSVTKGFEALTDTSEAVGDEFWTDRLKTTIFEQMIELVKDGPGELGYAVELSTERGERIISTCIAEKMQGRLTVVEKLIL